MSSNGQNGDKPHTLRPPVERTALETVQESIEGHRAEEAVTGLPTEELGLPSSDEDILYGWKRKEAPVTLDVLHEGLIAVSQIAEASIEAGIKIGSDLRKVLPTIARNATQIDIIAAKVEANSSHVNQVDQDVVNSGKVLDEIRRDVQFLKDDMREVKLALGVLPAIKELLGEILTKLPG